MKKPCKECVTDYYRMTGEKHIRSVKNVLQVILRHNLRYMWCYRTNSSFFWEKPARYKLFSYFRKGG